MKLIEIEHEQLKPGDHVCDINNIERGIVFEVIKVDQDVAYMKLLSEDKYVPYSTEENEKYYPFNPCFWYLINY